MAVGIGRRLAAEGLGTALLVAVVIGSGIMGERLAGGNAAVALLGNTLATGAALVMLITILGPISGAHFNPAVTLYVALSREFHLRDLPAYVAVQILGGLAGLLDGALFEHHVLHSARQALNTFLGLVSRQEFLPLISLLL